MQLEALQSLLLENDRNVHQFNSMVDSWILIKALQHCKRVYVLSGAWFSKWQGVANTHNTDLGLFLFVCILFPILTSWKDSCYFRLHGWKICKIGENYILWWEQSISMNLLYVNVRTRKKYAFLTCTSHITQACYLLINTDCWMSSFVCSDFWGAIIQQEKMCQGVFKLIIMNMNSNLFFFSFFSVHCLNETSIYFQQVRWV